MCIVFSSWEISQILNILALIIQLIAFIFLEKSSKYEMQKSPGVSLVTWINLIKTKKYVIKK
jgi:hypothetical protein